MNNVKFKTERLNLRPISEQDIENIHKLHSLAETDKFNTLGIPKDITETIKAILVKGKQKEFENSSPITNIDSSLFKKKILIGK